MAGLGGNNIENTEKGISWIERLMTLVDKYSIWKFFKAFMVILSIALIVGFISNPTFLFEKYSEWQEKVHSEKMELRMRNNEKLHILCEKLMYRVGADRVVVLELHNGLSSNAGIPFAKCSATYEALGEGVYPVADYYQDVNLSLMPFANFIFDKGYWCGDVQSLNDIDRGLYHKMASNDTQHFACCVIEGVDKPLAFLFVSFKELPGEEHNCTAVRENVRHIALELALLLELNKVD